MKPERLWKTTIEIWTDFYPEEMEMDDLAREAINGDGYCTLRHTESVTDKNRFPETSFFGEED